MIHREREKKKQRQRQGQIETQRTREGVARLFRTMETVMCVIIQV